MAEEPNIETVRSLYEEGRALVALTDRMPAEEARLEYVQRVMENTLRCKPCLEGIHDCKYPTPARRGRWSCCCIQTFGDLLDRRDKELTRAH